jgi:hypothetical protein
LSKRVLVTSFPALRKLFWLLDWRAISAGFKHSFAIMDEADDSLLREDALDALEDDMLDGEPQWYDMYYYKLSCIFSTHIGWQRWLVRFRSRDSLYFAIHRTNSITAELSKPYPDRHALKSFCSGHVLPSEVRRTLWQHLLGVQRKPDILGKWEITGELKTAALLRAECDAQAGVRTLIVSYHVEKQAVSGQFR